MGYNRYMSKKETKTSKLSKQPGRFAAIDLEKPFGHRVRKRAASEKLRELLAKAFDDGHSETEVVLGALHLLLGSAKAQVPKSSFKEGKGKEAQAAVGRLFELLRKAAPSSMAARVVVEDGQLKAKTPEVEPRDEREGLNSEQLAVLYPGRAVLYPHSTVVRLYK